MQTYKLTDSWGLEHDYTLSETELLKLAYDLYCGQPVGEELANARKEFDNDIPKTISYIKKECGWQATVIPASKA